MLIRSMSSAVSGLRAYQTWLDVTGNNIANIATPGFKASRVRFEDVVSITMRGASLPDPTTGRAGRNPAQVGLGSVAAGVEAIFTPGTTTSTGKESHLAIMGDGYFVVADGVQTYYTRDGSFDLGLDHRLVNPSTGLYVMGWQADANGVIDTSQPLSSIVIPIGQRMDAMPSASIVAQGNLDAGAAVGDTYQTQVTVVDSLGFQHSLTLTYTKTATNIWTWTYSTTEPGVTLTNTTGTVEFDNQGNVLTITPSGDLTVQWGNGAADTIITGGGDFTRLTQLARASNSVAVADGWIAGELTGFAVSDSGVITGIFSNGATLPLGQVALATFANPAGLMKAGRNLLTTSPNSGQAVVGPPASGGRGQIISSHLEMSNVDLAEEFTNMILAERGFQANSRVVTTSDEVLQDLVNLKR
ncbi:MAG: flagellar hook protein FlgE [Sphaerobacter sp.]|nr:flagellar hook protein FlgE [Sphaerobacter sp.]